MSWGLVMCSAHRCCRLCLATSENSSSYSRFAKQPCTLKLCNFALPSAMRRSAGAALTNGADAKCARALPWRDMCVRRLLCHASVQLPPHATRTLSRSPATTSPPLARQLLPPLPLPLQSPLPPSPVPLPPFPPPPRQPTMPSASQPSAPQNSPPPASVLASAGAAGATTTSSLARGNTPPASPRSRRHSPSLRRSRHTMRGTAPDSATRHRRHTSRAAGTSRQHMRAPMRSSTSSPSMSTDEAWGDSWPLRLSVSS
mmetsp:Transcript_20161/g.59856  ORF Transcript_20161/g.59856 Transcript_20161/m.59856 type:complete len:257 (-) Transcript_20161:308-1078(-)